MSEIASQRPSRIVVDLDAIGHHLGGLETHRRFRELRGLITLDEAFSDIEGGGEDAP